MSALIKECLNALKAASALSGGTADRLDVAKASELLQALHVEGESLQADTVKALALDVGWPEPQATRLAGLAREVSAGRCAITWSLRNWGFPVVAMIKGELERTRR